MGFFIGALLFSANVFANDFNIGMSWGCSVSSGSQSEEIQSTQSVVSIPLNDAGYGEYSERTEIYGRVLQREVIVVNNDSECELTATLMMDKNSATATISCETLKIDGLYSLGILDIFEGQNYSSFYTIHYYE